MTKKEQKVETTTKTAIDGKPMLAAVLFIRLIGLPFFAALSLIGVLVLWLRYMKNYIRYGGEAISYTKNMQRKTIADVFEQMQKQLDAAKNGS